MLCICVQLQRPATRKLHPSPYDKSTSIRTSSCFLYLSRCAPVYMSLNGRFRFSLSSSNAYRLANFTHLPTISHHRLSSFVVIPLSQSLRSSLYGDEQGASAFLIFFYLLVYTKKHFVCVLFFG